MLSIPWLQAPKHGFQDGRGRARSGRSAHLRDLVGDIPSPDEVSGLFCPCDCSLDASAFFVMAGPPAKVIISIFNSML